MAVLCCNKACRFVFASIRPTFRDFFNIYWGINSKLCMHLVGSTTHRVWIASSSGYKDLFWQSQVNQIWYIGIYPSVSGHGIRFLQNANFHNFGNYLSAILDFPEVFFLYITRYQFQTWYINPAAGMTHRVWVSSQLRHFGLISSHK